MMTKEKRVDTSQLYEREINVVVRVGNNGSKRNQIDKYGLLATRPRRFVRSYEPVLSCQSFLLSLDRTCLNNLERSENELDLFFSPVVDGGWSRWSTWSVCGSDCTHTRRRSCDEPPPSHGGRLCQGRDINVANCTGGMCNGKSPANFSTS